jgi:Chitobiase/beta-hexosaminidase C-terminal domain/FG-GAP-like repeat/IPT/TIG domain
LGSSKAGLAAALLALLIALPYKAVAAPASAPTATHLAMAAGANSLASGATVPSGTVLTFVASVSAGTTKLTQGQVKLCDGSAPSCTDIHQFGMAQLTRAGTARFRFVPGIGSHRYKAVFAGTPGGSPAYAASSSATVALTVTGSGAKATTTTTLAVTGDGGHYALTATVKGIVNRPGLSAPTGMVSFLDTTAANKVLGTSAVESASSGLTFSQVSSSPPPTVSGIFATADFNGDGFADVVVAGSFSDELDVLLGNGDGSFGPVATTTMTAQYGGPAAVADFNGDGIPDLAVWANFNVYSVTILLGKGDGTFSAVSSLDHITSQAMVTGDFNGDGIADLATAEGYAVSVYFGKGDGTFTAASKNSWPGINPLYLATGDFNGDGLTDLAVSDTAVPGSVFLLLNKGDGTFSKTDLTPPTGIFVGGIAAGDLNRDGILDLALADGVTVLLGNGDGTFQAPKLYNASPSGSVVIGDFNGDGVPDLAVGVVALLLGNGNGTFGDAIIGDANEQGSGNLATADFNGDGFPDVVLIGADVSVLLAQPTESVTATLPDVVLTQPGTYQMVAKYSGDGFYQPSSSSVDNLSFRLTPTVTVTPSATSVQSPDPLSVAVVVTGVKGYPVPTGLVDVTNATPYNSGYISNYVLLDHGSASIPITTSGLYIGTNALTVNYLPDAASQSVYEGQTGSASVVMTIAPAAAAPQFSPPAGTYSTSQAVILTDTTPSSTMYYTLDGSDPTNASAVYNGPIGVTSTETIKAIAMANGYIASPISTASYTIGAPASEQVLASLSPALTSAGSQGFALTVNGSSFSGNSIVFWGATPLATQFVNSTQVVAQVPAADTVTAGTIPITVRTPAPGETVSNALQFEIDSATTGSTTAPIFTNATATIAAGSTATYPVKLPSMATSVSAICLNLPAGATCSYSAASGAITISTQSTTPAGTHTVTVVFTETEPGAAVAIALLPILLLPFACSRKKTSSRPLWPSALLGILLLVTAASISACGGSSGSTQTQPTASHQVTSSATVSLTVQ